MITMRRALLFSGLLGVTGCSLLLSTSDLSGDGAAGGGPDAGADVVSAEADATTPDPQSGDSASDGGGTVPQGAALVFLKSSSGYTARVDGFFELTFAASSYHALKEVNLLSTASSRKISSSLIPIQPPVPLVDAVWLNHDATISGPGASVDLDAAPVVVSFDTWVHHVLSGGRDLKRLMRFTVHASGRITVHSRMYSGGSSAVDATEWAYHEIWTNESVAWDVLETASKSAAGFLEKGTSRTSLIMINQASDIDLQGGPTSRLWKMPARTFAPGDQEEKIGEIQLGASKDEIGPRAEDVRNAFIEVLAGGDGPNYGLYRVAATTGTLEIALGSAQSRFMPTFEIEDLAGASQWKVTLDGKLVASASNPTTALGAGKYDAAASRLYFAYFGVIPEGASLAQRKFVIER
jgi:hypothetical protein